MISQPRKPFYSTHIATRWGDMDAYGHINNAMYFRYMEEARIQFLLKMGSNMDGKGLGPVIINAFSTFLIPVVYPDTIRVDCYLSEPGRSSFMTHYKLYSQTQNDILVCEGSSKVVWIDTGTNISVPLPDSIRSMINKADREITANPDN